MSIKTVTDISCSANVKETLTVQRIVVNGLLIALFTTLSRTIYHTSTIVLYLHIYPFAAKVANAKVASLAQSRTKTNPRLLIKIALFTWGVYDANRHTEHSMLSKNTKTDCKSIQ
jgi:hypothetical protein